MGKRVLLINPNQYHYPPVIPIGLEYVSHALRESGHEPIMLDLCFEDAPMQQTASTLARFAPEVVCVTIRNIDSVLYPDTEFFLPAIRDLIKEVRAHSKAPVIVGGAGMGADPEGILSFTGADAGVVGPGESILAELVSSGEQLKNSGKIFKGTPPGDYVYSRGDAAYHAEYLEKGALGGFTTHTGCSSGCPYCMEARTAVCLRNPVSVAQEVAALIGSGMDHLHLCDPEFNEDIDHASEVLRQIIKEAPSLKWALYMRPGHFSPALFELLGKSGAYLVTLSVDTCKHDNSYLNNISGMIRLAKENGISTCVDLLAGLPDEEEGLLERTLETLSRAKPKEAVINTTLRLQKVLPITRRVLDSEAHGRHIIDNGAGLDSLLYPVFYQRITPGQLKDMTGGLSMFRIAGEEKIVNYQLDDEDLRD